MPPKAEVVETMDHESLVKEVLKLRADLKRLQKAVRKLSKTEDDEDKPKKLSGFAKPMKMSKELCDFLGVTHDTLMARTDVTKEINKYVKANNLQNPENKRELILDAKLKTILTVPSDVTLTFFNLQKYMSHHYIKDTEPVATKATSVVSEKAEEKPVKKVVKKTVRPPSAKA
jgi:chromatin remodeling complex protein RSC6